MAKYVIFNADDFGASSGIDSGIIEAHTRGVVTSASLMVTGRAAREAADLSRHHPALAVGLHWDVWGEDERTFDTGDIVAARGELARQLEQFYDLMGRPPTHLDSHRHAHRTPLLMPVFREAARSLAIPLRHDGPVRYVGGFYAQWEWQVTDLEHVSVPFLQSLLQRETVEGWTEFGCHPGFDNGDFHSVYLREREEEVRTLTSPAVRDMIREQGLILASFADLPALAPQPTSPVTQEPSIAGAN